MLFERGKVCMKTGNKKWGKCERKRKKVKDKGRIIVKG
jgi:hypothetical protein